MFDVISSQTMANGIANQKMDIENFGLICSMHFSIICQHLEHFIPMIAVGPALGQGSALGGAVRTLGVSWRPGLRG